MKRQHPDPDPLTVWPPQPVFVERPVSVVVPLTLLSALVAVLLVVLVIGVAATSRPQQESPPAPAAPEPPLALASGAGSEGISWVPTTSKLAAATPAPSGAIGSPLLVRRGWATYCAPTPRHCQSWGGSALLGAVESFRSGDRPYTVRVCRADRPTRCVRVHVVSFCACGSRRGEPTVIDLSPAAFRELAPLSRGIVRVVVESTTIAPPETAKVEASWRAMTDDQRWAFWLAVLAAYVVVRRFLGRIIR